MSFEVGGFPILIFRNLFSFFVKLCYRSYSTAKCWILFDVNFLATNQVMMQFGLMNGVVNGGSEIFILKVS